MSETSVPGMGMAATQPAYQNAGKMAKSSGKAGYIGGAILFILGLGIIGMTIFRPELLKIKEFKEVGYTFGTCASVAGIGIMLIQRDHNIQDSL